MDCSPHCLSEISKQKKPDFSQSFPTHGNSKSSLDKDGNPGFSQSLTSDVRSEDESSKKSADDFKTSGFSLSFTRDLRSEGESSKKSAEDFKTSESSQRKLASEKDSYGGLKIDLCESVGSVDDTPSHKSQQSNTFINHEIDDFDNPLDDIFGRECGPELEEFPDLFNHDEPEESRASSVNESVASLPTACKDPQTLLEEHMHHCPTAAHHHNVCCKCNQFTKNQHMLYELAKTEGLEMHDVVPDGNCMFRAIIDQLRMQGELTLTCHRIRQRAVDYLKNNPLQDDGTHLEDFFVEDDESWEEYLKRISRDGEWGDQIILRGLAEVVNREISIITTIGDLHNQTSITPKGADKDKVKTIYLGHVNDQHYYSLRPKEWHNQWYRGARREQLSEHRHFYSNDLEEQSNSLEESSSEEELTFPCRPSKLINFSSKLPRNNMPLKDIFQKKIENSSSFLSDVWKPRHKDVNQITEDNDEANHHNFRKDGKHHTRLTKNCLQVQEVFENNSDDKEERQISCSCGSETYPLKIRNRLKREDPPEKRIINDFEMMKSYNATDGRLPFPFVTLMWFPGDSDDKRPSSSDEDSYEERSQDFGSSATMKFLNEAFPGFLEGKSRTLDKKKIENTRKQSKDFELSPKPSRPPSKPPGLQFQLSISIDEDEKIKNDKSLNTCEMSVIDRVDHLNHGKSTEDDDSVEVGDTNSNNRVIKDEYKLRISMDCSLHSLSENSKQKKPDFSQSFPTSGNSKSSLDKDSNPVFSQSFTSDVRSEVESSKKSADDFKTSGFSLSFTSDLRSEGESSTKSAEDFKTSGSSHRKLASEKDSSGGLKTELNKSDSSMDDTLPYKNQQSNTFLSPEMDDFDDPLDDIFGAECGPEMEELPGLYDPEDCHASCGNESAASLPTDLQTVFEEHMDHCPAALTKHHVCCKCNPFTKNQHMLYELVRTEGLEMHDVVPDGNCMFRAIIDQLRMQGIITMTCNGIRQMAVEYLRNNPLQNDGTHLEDFFVAEDESWEEYLKRMSKDGEWGDQIVLRGLAEVIDREICIISTFGDLHNQTTITPQGSSKVKKIYLGHVNDQHYYSLRPRGWHEKWYKETRRIQLEQKSGRGAEDIDNQEIIKEESLQMEKLTLPCRPSKLINCSYQFTDQYSHVPVFHLNFIIENVLPESNIYTPYRYHGGRDYIVTSATTKVFDVVGSVEEGLSVNLYAVSLQNDRSMGNESLNTIKATSLPNLYKQNGNYTLVFKENFMELKGEVIIIDTENSTPGYAFLKLGINQPQKFFKKVYGSYYLSNVYFQTEPKKIDLPHSKNPSLPFQKAASYTLYYGKCPRWPKEANEWVSRDRPSGWPDITLVNKTTKVPCVLTPKGHLLSTKPDIEWMFDFSFPEKFLLKDNVTKDKKYCFHVFKLLMDYHTGLRKELSTFVLKTIFLYTLEVIPSQQWEVCPSACVLYLIETLLLSLKEGKIPHYFIPENNIISHLNGSVLYKLIEKVNVVREFPIMSVILMAESHGLMTTYATDQIIEDLNHLSDHSNIHDSMLNTFIPAYSKIAVTSLSLMKFRQAVAAVTTGYRMLQELPCCSDGGGHPYGDITLEGFIKEATGQSGLQFYQVWWLCFFVDLYKKENTLPSYIHSNPFKKISDMMRDCPPGDLDDVSVPNSVLQFYRSEIDYKSMHDIYFIIQLCWFLFSEGEYSLAAHYYRGMIKMLTEVMSDTDAIMAEILQSYQFRQGMEAKIDFLVQTYVTTVSTNLCNALYSLYKCYLFQGQPEYFQEYVDQFDSVCNSLSTSSAFHLLADVWKALGNKHKMKEALEKQDSMKA